MSVASMVRRKGDLVRQYRPVYGRNEDGTPKVLSWALVTSLRCVFEPISDALARKAFGTSEIVDERGWIAGIPDVQLNDALVISGSRRTGAAFRVLEVPTYDFKSKNAHLELALQSTTETIP